jgi:hypothetical protein
MGIEVIKKDGVTYAEVIRAGTRVDRTTFFSPAKSSFQFGLLAHGAGYAEAPHYHKPARRVITDLQQMFVVQRGLVDVQLFSDEGEMFEVIRLTQGDAIVLVHGAHAIEVVEDMQCLSVKQGPFLGDEEDQIPIRIA